MKRTRSNKPVKSTGKDLHKDDDIIIISDNRMKSLLSTLKDNKSRIYPVEFIIQQIYTNSNRMYCKMSEDMFYYLFGYSFAEMSEIISHCSDNGFFPLKKSRTDEYIVVIKFSNLKQIELLKDENEQYGYKTNVVVCGEVSTFPYFKYPEDHNYGICIKLTNNISFL